MGKSHAIQSLVAIVLSAAFGLLMIEGFLMWRPELQAQLPLQNLVSCDGPPREGRAHARFGWTAVPDSAFFAQKSEADGWTVHINDSDGFRDLYDHGSTHAIVLGDSFTEGVNANNDEAFPHLLDVWNPDLAFHNFGMSGYATSNALAVYEAVGSGIPHDLVILAYFLGNDLRDNLQRAGLPGSPDEADTWHGFLQEVNSTIRQYWRGYNLLYKALRPQFGGSDLSDEKIRKGIDITNDLVSAFVAEVKSNQADLLLLVLPSWNQMNGYSGLNEEKQQKSLLEKYDDEWDHVYLIDMSAEIDRVGSDRFYGIKDKHFSPLGYYTTASVVHHWINSDWPRGRRTARVAPAFQPRAAQVDPDCASMTEYREAFANPVADPSRLIAERDAHRGMR